ncbi:MAG: hypothetical protein CMJ83_14400 [Planctomycetes bacterium]|nr:hypothetical protein [Planctomycetota bacterium]
MLRTLVACFVLVVAVSSPACAQVRLPKIFTNHMVLQQELPIAVWGWASPAEVVRVQVAGRSVETRAGADGRWRVDLPAMKADGKQHTLEVSGKTTVRRSNVVLGEVWLCAGQSNMNREARVREPDPDIRLFWIDGSVTPRRDDLGDQVAGWVPSTPGDVAAAAPTLRRGKPVKRTGFAEVGYVFGRRVHRELGVPVGLIKCAFGGSQVQAWTPDPTLPERVAYGTKAEGGYLGHRSGLLYRSMVHGMVPLTIRGVLWYQGENDGRSKVYDQHLETWITSWRTLWKRPQLPFYMVQIAPTSYAGGRMQYIWEAQTRVMHRVAHTAVAVSNDIYLHGKRPESEVIDAAGRLTMSPSNPHPPNKHIVGERLANIALVDTYGKNARVLYGPMLASHEIRGDALVVKMRYCGEGLKTRHGKAPNWFELSDGTVEKRRLVFRPATAKIVGPDRIEVRSAEIAHPKFVRFAWHCTAIHNLQNSAGLPAVSFRTDTADR